MVDFCNVEIGKIYFYVNLQIVAYAIRDGMRKCSWFSRSTMSFVAPIPLYWDSKLYITFQLFYIDFQWITPEWQIGRPMEPKTTDHSHDSTNLQSVICVIYTVWWSLCRMYIAGIGEAFSIRMDVSSKSEKTHSCSGKTHFCKSTQSPCTQSP